MRQGAKSLVKTNLHYWMNNIFLSNGLYDTVSIGEVDLYGNDISSFIPISSDPKFADGRVFQSAFKNWVYEPNIASPGSGITPPIIASGITVNGVFYPDSTVGAFAHFLDFPNGRVVFDSPIANGSVVQGEFSYKQVHVELAKKQNNENKDLLIQTSYKDNPAQTGIQIYPQEKSTTLPAVWIDVQARNSLPYELGTKDPIKEYLGVFHIWTHVDFEMDIVEEILADAQREVILGVDFNDAPFPLLSNGRRNTSWPGYESQANLYSSYFWRRIYLDSSNARARPSLFEIERSEVSFNIKVYPNF